MNPMLRRLASVLDLRRSKRAAAGAIVAQLALVGLVDYATGIEMSFGIFYLFPVGTAAWYFRLRAALAVCLAAALVWLWADCSAGHRYSHAAIPYWNAAARFLCFSIVASLLARIRKLTVVLTQSVAQTTVLLEAEVQARHRLEARMVETADLERREVAHDLQEEVSQQLAGVALKAKLIETGSGKDTGTVRQDASAVGAAITAVIGHIRRLARSLDPIEVEPQGLVAALEQMAFRTGEKHGIKCVVKSAGCALELSVPASLAVFHICQEAISNAVKHGQARNVRVYLCNTRKELNFEISDGGVGFNVSAASRGLGLQIMRYRAEQFGGRLEFGSESGRGTVITCVLPAQA